MSFENPFGFAIIQSWFPQRLSGTANSVFNTALYIGGGVASLNVPLMMNYGWRFDFYYMGYLGIAFGVLGLIFLRDESIDARSEE